MSSGILSRYLRRAVLLRLALVLLALCVTYLLFLLGDLGRRLAPELGWGPVLRAGLLHLPLAAVQLLPAALLLAAVLALAELRRRGELEAMAALGVAPARLLSPLLRLGGLTALATLGVGELVVPPCERAADVIYGGRRASALTGLLPPSSWARSGSWFIRYEPASGELLALEVDDAFRARRRFDGRRRGGETRGTTTWLGPGGARLAAGAPPLPPLAALGAEGTFRAEAESLWTLRRRLVRMRALGQTRTAEELVLQSKIAFPLWCLIAALCCGAFVGPRRRSAPLRDLALALGILIGLWVLLALGWMLGRVGWLSPAASVWGATGVALAGGLLAAGRLWIRALR